MNKNRKTSHILNVFQFDANGHVILPATLTIGENPHSSDNTSKIPSTAWIRTYVTGLSYLTGNQSITVSGDATGSGTTAITLTLANTAVTPGTYGSTTLVPVVTVDSKGRITSVTTAAISGSLTFTGDVTGSGTTGTSTGLTLAASGVTAGTYTKVTVDSKGRVTVGANASTTDISEGTNLYYTDARVGTYLTANSYATQSYVGTQVANLVAAAPATLDTLNELAAALGNDPSFATTVSTSIGTKVPQTRTLTINGTGYDLSADRSWTINSMVYPGAGIALSTGTAWGTSITDNSANWNTAYGWGNHASGGYLTGITSGNVTTALGYTPYNSTNPSGYITSSGSISGTAAYATQWGTSSGYANFSSTAISASVGWLFGTTGNGTYAPVSLASVATLLSLGSLAYSSATIPTNNNQLTNGAGYITSYTETDTLSSVVARGSSTTSAISAANFQVASQVLNLDTVKTPGLYHYDGAYTGTQPLSTPWYNVRTIEIGNSTRASQFVMPYSADRIFYRRNTDPGWQPYVELYHTGNIPTWNQNTTGTAANSTLWNGAGYSYTATSTVNSYILGLSANGDWRPMTTAAIQSWLGLGSLAYSSATIPTNNNQLTNGAGYITSYTETDTLSSVVARGASTSTGITINPNGTSITMGGGSSAEGIRMQASTSTTYPVFLRSVNPAGGGETSAWLFKEDSTPWGIWHNNPTNTFDFTSAGSGGIAQNVGGGTNQVMVRIDPAAGYVQTSAGFKNSAGTITLDNSGNISGNAATVSNGIYTTGSYANPAWITSLAYSKITGVPAFITSYTETDTLASVTGRGATTTAAITISKEALAYGGTTQSFLIDGAGGNAALTINAASAYAYLNFAQAGVSKWEIGAEGAATNKGSLYFNHNIQSGSAGAALYLKKSNGYVGILNTDPQVALHVTGAGTFTGNLNAANLSGTNTGDQTNISGNAATATSATQVVTIQDAAPSGVAGKLWWESDTGTLKAYYGAAWIDASPIPDSSLYYSKAGGVITGDVSIGQTLNVVGNTLVQGTISAFGDVIADSSSDARLKDNSTAIESPLEKVCKINGVSFNWNDKQSAYEVGKKDIGVIAQEVEEVLPELVTTRDNGYKAVRYEKIVALLIEAVKEQQTQINNLTDKINNL